MMKITDLKILIVEDDDFQRDILNSILESLGITSVFNAGNGKQALDIIHGIGPDSIDIALCDLNMPEMDGMEFLRHLGEEQQNIAVILTSALDGKLLASVGRMTRMYGIKLLGMIEKPVMLANLRELLAKFDHSVGRVEQAPTRRFSLDEILQGIDADQFEPFFQPKVDLKSGRLIGAEALARWIHPESGVVGPYAFIPPLEQTGNIDDLTFRILRKSAAAVRSFHDRGHLFTVSVNLSLVSLDDTRLADRITQTVRETGIDPQYIVLEITESAAMTNVAPALENLARLCMNGFALSIDDYGTGSSNLQQLTRIAFSELKIDQSFVKDFSENKALRIVVESSIDMAHKLLVKSVAEGVETKQDWDALKTVGCDVVQGYYIAKPMDEKSFHDFVANYKHASPDSMEQQPGGQVRPQQGKLKLLVIEDDDFTRKIILRVLRDFGYSDIVEANNAATAMKLFEVRAFDLVLTDVNMPGINGLRLVQMIRAGKTRSRPDTRIVVLSSFSQTEILGTALALDINGFLVKPIIPAVVEEKLAQAMTEKMHLHSPIAYEAVKTELRSLSSIVEPATRVQGGAAITLESGKTRNIGENPRALQQALHRLRPGMKLVEHVRLKDGTLILSSGHILSEMSINRLNDLKVLLPAGGVLVQEVPA